MAEGGCRPLVLVSDFGLADPYVGQVKGVFHARCPGGVVIDLYHEVPPFQVASGAFVIACCLPHMPDDAVWLCVVDPGVGSRRRPLALSLAGSCFVAPDNGLLTPLLARPGVQVVAIDPVPYGPLSTTFHGRDLFAKAAARLAAGEPLHHLGPPLPDPVRLPDDGLRMGADGVMAQVMLVDRFGNLVTALPGHLAPSITRATLNGLDCGPRVQTFSSLPPGEAALLVGGFGTVEVVVNQGSAAGRFAAGVGDWVAFSGLDQYTARKAPFPAADLAQRDLPPGKGFFAKALSVIISPSHPWDGSQKGEAPATSCTAPSSTVHPASELIP